MTSRIRRIGAPVVVSLALALAAAPSADAGVPGGYDATPVDNPPASATAGDEFGLHIVDAGDVNGDGRDDLLVGVPNAPTGLPNITGKVVYVDGLSGGIIRTVGAPFPQVSHAGANTDFGAQVARLGDVTGDGVPEQVVSAPGTDVTSAGIDMGSVYVLNGSTGAIVKQIQLDPEDRPGTPPSFGAGLAAGSGDPACLGHGGTGACPNPDGSRVAIGDS